MKFLQFLLRPTRESLMCCLTLLLIGMLGNCIAQETKPSINLRQDGLRISLPSKPPSGDTIKVTVRVILEDAFCDGDSAMRKSPETTKRYLLQICDTTSHPAITGSKFLVALSAMCLNCGRNGVDSKPIEVAIVVYAPTPLGRQDTAYSTPEVEIQSNVKSLRALPCRRFVLREMDFVRFWVTRVFPEN